MATIDAHLAAIPERARYVRGARERRLRALRTATLPDTCLMELIDDVARWRTYCESSASPGTE